jgi:hypothetical protein
MREIGVSVGYLGNRKNIRLTKKHKTEEGGLWAMSFHLGYVK